jgi:hypothetical protein
MDLATLRSRLARRWWIVAAVAALTALGAGTAAAGSSDDHKTTIEFVLRPDAGVSNDDLPGTLDALNSDGSLVQTVIGVLGSRGMLRRAAEDADVVLSPDYTIESTAQPGSAVIDSTLAGPDGALVERLIVGYERAASNYVAASYSAYVLEPLTTGPADDAGPGTAEVVILSLLVGAALGIALVAAELRFEPQLRPLVARLGREPDGRPEPDAPPKAATRGRTRAQVKPTPAPDTDGRPMSDAPSESDAPPKSGNGPKPADQPKKGARAKTGSRSKAAAGSKAAPRSKAGARAKSSSARKPAAPPRPAAPPQPNSPTPAGPPQDPEDGDRTPSGTEDQG